MIIVTGTQLLMHLIGDYVIQTDHQALNKKKPGTNNALLCLTHCITYILPFILMKKENLVF